MDRYLLFSSYSKITTMASLTLEENELKALVSAVGGTVAHSLFQRREKHAKGGFIGKGKVEEISEILKQDKEITCMVFNARIKPSEMQRYVEIFHEVDPNVKIIDRVELILEIFSKHAQTKDAKLQIEQAKLRHGAHLFSHLGEQLSRQGGGTGARGSGETNTEIEQRDLKEQIRRNKARIENLNASRQMLIDNRKRQNIHTVSLIGYTNAGKTSLFNQLTGKDKLINDALFVTLDSSVGSLKTRNMKVNTLISDTIGFISNLPPKLIEAFRSTLMESIYADILLHVVDISDPKYKKKIQVVESILKDLNILNKPRLLVCSKIDLLPTVERVEIRQHYNHLNPQFVSVKEQQGIGRLVRTIAKMLE